MKKLFGLITVLSTVLLLVGCKVDKESSKNTSSQQAAAQSKVNEVQTNEVDQIYPWRVDPSKLPDKLLFLRAGQNIPTIIRLEGLKSDKPTLTFAGLMEVKDTTATQVIKQHVYATYYISFQDTKQTNLTVDTANDNSDKTQAVKVNTQIILGKVKTADSPSRTFSGIPLYIFKNKGGSYSITTPNFAGNSDDKSADLSLEYLQGKESDIYTK